MRDVGVDLKYVVEKGPVGNWRRYSQRRQRLNLDPDDPVIVFNGDVLTGPDLAGLVQAWRDADADVALYLTRVEDPRAFGLVPTDSDGNDRILEKPQTPRKLLPTRSMLAVTCFGGR